MMATHKRTTISSPKEKHCRGSDRSLSTAIVSSLSSGKSSDTSTSRSQKNQMRMSCLVWTSRITFILCLLLAAILLSFGAHRMLKKSEENMAEEHFDGIAERALNEALKQTLHKRQAAKSLAALASYTFPNAHQWPNITIYGFEGIAQSMMNAVEVVSMGVCVTVPPSDLEEFEDFAYNTAFTKINSHYPNTTGMKDYGEGLTKGVWGSDASFQVVRRTDGTTNWNSTHDILTPFIMHSAGPPLLMFDIHSMERFGKTIDELIDCASSPSDQNQVEIGGDPFDNSYLNRCAILSDIIVMYDAQGQETGPSAHIMQPIYPSNDRSSLTGFVTSSIKWDNVLESLFSPDVTGVDCVLETESLVYTYHVTTGKPELKGAGRLHDRSYEQYAKSIDLFSEELFTHTSARYTLTLYPCDDLFDVFGTNNPTTGLVGTLCIMLFTAILFIVYDHFVRKELFRKQAITEARRLFVRFISHEIRSPLHSICMGATLLQTTLSRYTQRGAASSTNRMQETGEVLSLQEQVLDWSDLASDVMVNANSAVNVLADLVVSYEKVKSDSLPLDLSVIPIRSLIERSAAEFRLPLAAKNIEFKVEFSDIETEGVEATREASLTDDCESGRPSQLFDLSLQYVIGDPIRISQVLRTFLSNAMEYSDNTGQIQIKASWKQLSLKDSAKQVSKSFVLENQTEVMSTQTGWIEVSVQDSGSGLSVEEIQNVWDATQFTLSDLHSGQASGLGLCMSRRIAEQHGGAIEIASAGKGRGTKFSLILPLREVPEEVRPACPTRAIPIEDESTASDPEEPRKFRILVVDDAKVCRKLLMRILKAKGHICDEAENGLQAVEKVQKAMHDGEQYDTVLCDYEMPVMKGPEAVSKMREIGYTKFIAGLTGNVLPEDVKFFKDHGANCVLPKPLNMNDLESKWDQHRVTCCEHCWENLDCNTQ